MSEQRYEIGVLIGPCEKEEAEEALDHVILATERDLVGLGAAFALRVWHDDEPVKKRAKPEDKQRKMGENKSA